MGIRTYKSHDQTLIDFFLQIIKILRMIKEMFYKKVTNN